MKKTSTLINRISIIVLLIFSAAFLLYGVNMIRNSIHYINLYDGTASASSAAQYVITSCASYFGFALLTAAAALCLYNLDRIASSIVLQKNEAVKPAVAETEHTAENTESVSPIQVSDIFSSDTHGADISEVPEETVSDDGTSIENISDEKALENSAAQAEPVQEPEEEKESGNSASVENGTELSDISSSIEDMRSESDTTSSDTSEDHEECESTNLSDEDTPLSDFPENEVTIDETSVNDIDENITADSSSSEENASLENRSVLTDAYEQDISDGADEVSGKDSEIIESADEDSSSPVEELYITDDNDKENTSSDDGVSDNDSSTDSKTDDSDEKNTPEEQPFVYHEKISSSMIKDIFESR